MISNRNVVYVYFQFELKELKRRQEAAEEAERKRLQAERDAKAAAEAAVEAARRAESRDSHDAPGSPQREQGKLFGKIQKCIQQKQHKMVHSHLGQFDDKIYQNSLFDGLFNYFKLTKSLIFFRHIFLSLSISLSHCLCFYQFFFMLQTFLRFDIWISFESIQ